MAIMTIQDLEQASEKEIEEALKLVSIEEDLREYLQWLNSPDGEQVEVNFKVGWNKHRAASTGFHPSQTAKVGACNLKMYYDVTGEIEPKPKVNVDNLMTFDIGTACHALLQNHLLNMYEDQFEEEVWLQDKRILINSTHTDGRFTLSKTRFLLEIKTIKEGGNFGFAKVQDRPFPDNVRQVMTYMHLDDCPFGLIFYLCKNNGKMVEHPIVWDQKVWDEMYTDNMAPTLKALETGTKPLPTTGWHCRQCDYLHGCPAGKDEKYGRKVDRRRAVPLGPRGRHVLYKHKRR